MNRMEALRVIDRVTGDDPLVITCGATARELASFSVRPSHLPLLDSMGSTTPVGLGVALGHSGPVTVIDGDGSLLMGFSVLATLACYAPGNLAVVVLDNGQHASADELASQARQVDLARAAEGLGLFTRRCPQATELEDALTVARRDNVFTFVHVRIDPGNSPGVPLLLADPAVLAARFHDSLLSSPTDD